MRYSEIVKPEYIAETREFEFSGKMISVRQHISAEEMYELIMTTLGQSKEGGIFNSFKLEMYFQLNLLFVYSDITFDDGEKADMFGLYDELYTSGLLQGVIDYIPAVDYEALRTYIEVISETTMKYGSSVGAIIESVINDLPEQVEAVSQIVENFDQEKYQKVIDFANAANGNRHFKTNEPIEE